MTDIWNSIIILESQTCVPVIVFDKGMHITDTVHCVNLEVQIYSVE